MAEVGVEHFACPFEGDICYWSPCKGMVMDAENDCTFDNPNMVAACKNSGENWGHPCAKGSDYYWDEGGGGIDISQFDFS